MRVKYKRWYIPIEASESFEKRWKELNEDLLKYKKIKKKISKVAFLSALSNKKVYFNDDEIRFMLNRRRFRV